MAVFDLIMPKMGESITEATILRWLLKEGDAVEIDQPILEIATDKVDSDIPSPVNGLIFSLLYKENDVVPVGTVIATIKVGQENITDNKLPSSPILQTEIAGIKEVENELKVDLPFLPESTSNGTKKTDRFYSPLVRTIAKEENIALSELELLTGSGAEGRVTKQDILSYVDHKKTGISIPAINLIDSKFLQPLKAPLETSIISSAHKDGNIEIIEMDRMRRLIADHMLNSNLTAPHVTSFVEADMTRIVQWRNQIKTSFQKKYNQNITFTPIFIHAVIEAIKAFPIINSSVEGYTILKKKDIHIGMATALPSGNLIVPVIRHADRLNLQGLTLAVNDLAQRARENKLKPDETGGGTFTVTNVGSFGSMMGTPIINQPQVAILATGSIKKKPAVLETEHGDVIAIRHLMFLSLSYDHRVIDGFVGGSFLKKIADVLESFDVSLII